MESGWAGLPLLFRWQRQQQKQEAEFLEAVQIRSQAENTGDVTEFQGSESQSFVREAAVRGVIMKGAVTLLQEEPSRFHLINDRAQVRCNRCAAKRCHHLQNHRG